MKFKIDKKVTEKYPDLIVKIPIILGFSNKNKTEANKKIMSLMKEREAEIRKIFSSIEELDEHKYIKPYLDIVRIYGRNPKKDMPTHYALIKRILEGKSIPDINPLVNLYNYVSIKFITPFGGEDLDTVYGDFVLKIAEGNEHWLGIGETYPKSPKAGELIWRDDYDVSTMSLNWRQCERTKITEDSKNGYFIMDGFVENSDNILEAVNYFVSLVKTEFGGEAEILNLEKENPIQNISFKSKSVKGVDIPKIIVKKLDIKNKVKQNKNDKKKEYIYEVGSYEDKYQDLLHKALASISINVDKNSIVVSKTTNEKFGDLTSTICLQIAKQLDKNPYEIAKDLIIHIEKSDWIEKIEIIKPGFINIFLKTEVYKELINLIDDEFGVSDFGQNKKVMIEFGQPNTHKNFTVGHVKSAVTGLSVSRLFSNLGYQVIKANYFGDIGLMVAKCLWGLMSKKLTVVDIKNLNDKNTEEILEELVNIYESKGAVEASKYINECYQIGANEYKRIEEEKKKDKITKDLSEKKNQFIKINLGVYSKENKYLKKLYEITRKISIEYQDISFAKLGVVYDRQYPESENAGHGLEIVKKYTGNIFIKDDGAVIFPGEKYGLKRWVFIASTGLPTYSGKDLGLAYKKFEEYPDLYLGIVLTSVEQVDYFKAVIKALELIDSKFVGRYKHIGFGWLLFDNKKASARSAGKSFGYDEGISEAKEKAKGLIDKSKNYSEEEIEEISDKVAVGAFKFNILSHEFHKNINYNYESAMSLQGFSGPYVMYSYVRAKAIIEKSGISHEINNKFDNKNFEKVLNSAPEVNLLKKLAEFPQIANTAGKNITPHLICVYLYELADLYNTFYNECNVLNSQDNLEKIARLKLVSAYAKVIKRGLYLLGIETVERM